MRFTRTILKSLGLAPYSDVAAHDKMRSHHLNEAILLAQELADMRVLHSDAKSEVERLRADNERLRADNDRLLHDILAAARTESMATERAWHAIEVAKLLKARLDAGSTPRGCICE